MSAIAVSPIARPPRDRRSTGFGSAAYTGEAGCWRRTAKKQADTMNVPSPAASIRYSGQWRRNASAAALCGTARVARRVFGFSRRQRAQPVRGEQLLLDDPHDGPSLLGPQQRERKRDGEDLIGPQPWVGPAVPTDHVVEATARRIPENLLEAAFDRLGFVRVGCGRPRVAAPVCP